MRHDAVVFCSGDRDPLCIDHGQPANQDVVDPREGRDSRIGGPLSDLPWPQRRGRIGKPGRLSPDFRVRVGGVELPREHQRHTGPLAIPGLE